MNSFIGWFTPTHLLTLSVFAVLFDIIFRGDFEEGVIGERFRRRVQMLLIIIALVLIKGLLK